MVNGKAATLALLLAAACAPAAEPPGPVAQPITAPAPATETRAPISFRELLARPRARADRRIAYGPGELQFGELWLPQGPGPHPVAVLVHGGCWRADLPGLELMDFMAEALRRDGWAVWNLEYRRLGHEGGGYPGTFADVGAGVDHLRTIGPELGLDLRRVVLAGHSAGGHLALWATLRERLPGPLENITALPVRGVVTLAGINDLEAYRADGPAACGGPATIDGVTGAAGGRTGAVYADTSPGALTGKRVTQVVISGERDPIVPPRFGQAYAAEAAAAGDPVTEITLPGAGHFELIDPTSAVWPAITAELRRVAG